MAKDKAGAEVLGDILTNVLESLREMTGGRGPDACTGAVGMETHGIGYAYHLVKQALRLETDRGEALRACCKGGALTVVGVYRMMNKFPLGVIMNQGLTVRTAQQQGQAHVLRLLDHAARGELDPSYPATHRLSFKDPPRGYEMFKNKENDCVRAVFTP